MGVNQTIESPDFDRIRKEGGRSVEDGIKLLWYTGNEEARLRRLSTKAVKDSFEKAVKTDAPASQQDNYDTGKVGVVHFTGSTSFTLTGLRNGAEGIIVILFNSGSGTITIADESASSDATNRFQTSTGANKSLTTDKAVVFIYLSSRWREMSLL